MNNLLLHKLCTILQRGFCELRNGAELLERQQIHDLADAFEIVPALISRWDDQSIAAMRNILATYQTKYPSSSYDYLSILDMSDSDYRDVFLAPHLDWANDGNSEEDLPLAVA